MTEAQAEQIILLLTNIREQITRLANAQARDGQFTFYPITFYPTGTPSREPLGQYTIQGTQERAT